MSEAPSACLLFAPSLCETLRDDPTEPDLGTFFWILSRMCWPNAWEASKEQAFFATLFAATLDHAMATMPFRQDAPAAGESSPMRDLAALMNLLVGGAKGLRSFPSADLVLADFRRRLVQGKWVGAILCMAYILRTQHEHQVGGISVRKICAFLARDPNPFFEKTPDVVTLEKAWKASRPTAHLWGGLFFVEMWMADHVAGTAKTDRPLQDILATLSMEHLSPLASHLTRAMLAMAQELQAFGLDYQPGHASKPMLDRNPDWSLADLPELHIRFPKVTLTKDQLLVFDDYQAPVDPKQNERRKRAREKARETREAQS